MTPERDFDGSRCQVRSSLPGGHGLGSILIHPPREAPATARVARIRIAGTEPLALERGLFGTLAAISAHLSFVHTRGGCGIVLVVTPRRMMEVDNEIAIV
jgi:hypothetical protein